MLRIEQDSDGTPSFSYLSNVGGRKEQCFDLKIYICEDPLCDCADITIEFIPREGPDSKHHQVVLDLQNSELKDSTSVGGEDSFCIRFFETLSQDNWDDLTFFHNQAKSMMCDAADYSSRHAEFSFEDVEKGNLIFYEDMIPYPAPIFVEIQETHIKVFDMYCLNPRCKCNDAHLLLHPMNDTNRDSLEETHISYDYKTNEWYLVERGTVDISPEILMDDLLSSYDASSIYSKRHNDLRLLYNTFRKEYAAKNVGNRSAKLSRNAACPCGSGKKYKKCCMLDEK